MVKTAVVILNWNGLSYLKLFLGNVADRSVDENTLLYVADNGSTDGSCEWIEQNRTDVRIIRFDKNHGFAGGYNLALEQIEAEYYVLLNSDIEVTDGWLKPMISYLDKNPDVASCQPTILSYNNKDHFEYAGAAGGFIDKYGFPFCRGRILSKVEKNEGQYNSLIDIFWSTGACMAVRSEAWKKSGGFDADFFAHMEEIDLCWRFHRMGYRISFIPETSVYHVGGGSLPYSSPFKTYLNFRNSIYLLYKNLPDKKFSRLMVTRKFIDGIAAVFFLLKGDFRSVMAVWKAHQDARRIKEKLREKRKAIKATGNSEPEGLILNKSLVFEFYIKRHKTFNSIKMKPGSL
jgi:GT2 family glycosyltransferase